MTDKIDDPEAFAGWLRRRVKSPWLKVCTAFEEQLCWNMLYHEAARQHLSKRGSLVVLAEIRRVKAIPQPGAVPKEDVGPSSPTAASGDGMDTYSLRALPCAWEPAAKTAINALVKFGLTSIKDVVDRTEDLGVETATALSTIPGVGKPIAVKLAAQIDHLRAFGPAGAKTTEPSGAAV